MLDRHIRQLQRYLAQLSTKTGEKYDSHINKVKTLIEQLEQLQKAIIVTKDYQQEKRKLIERTIHEQEIRAFTTQLERIIEKI